MVVVVVVVVVFIVVVIGGGGGVVVVVVVRKENKKIIIKGLGKNKKTKKQKTKKQKNKVVPFASWKWRREKGEEKGRKRETKRKKSSHPFFQNQNNKKQKKKKKKKIKIRSPKNSCQNNNIYMYFPYTNCSIFSFRKKHLIFRFFLNKIFSYMKTPYTYQHSLNLNSSQKIAKIRRGGAPSLAPLRSFSLFSFPPLTFSLFIHSPFSLPPLPTPDNTKKNYFSV